MRGYKGATLPEFMSYEALSAQGNPLLLLTKAIAQLPDPNLQMRDLQPPQRHRLTIPSTRCGTRGQIVLLLLQTRTGIRKFLLQPLSRSPGLT